MSQEMVSPCYLKQGRKQINICTVSDITALQNPLDRLATLPRNYKRLGVIKTKLKYKVKF